jgi:hypothetical protein
MNAMGTTIQAIGFEEATRGIAGFLRKREKHQRGIFPMAVLFAFTWIFAMSLCSSALAAGACDDCLAVCKGLPGCCTGTGCMCEDECLGSCGPCHEMKFYCTLQGVCWPTGCARKETDLNFPSQLFFSFDINAVPLNPAFYWSNVREAISYDARICSSGTCSSTLLQTSSKIRQWQIDSGLLPETEYYFQIQAVDECSHSGWGTVGFTTASCGFSLLPQANAYGPQSATGTVAVTPFLSGCSWAAESNDSWITITSGNSGTGNGTVSYSVSANTTENARIGSITIGGQGLDIFQVSSTFPDNPENVFTPYINAIYAGGITVGCGNGLYCPSDAVTRGQMAAFIVRSIYGEDFNYGTTPYFSDVPSTHSFFKYVQKMKDAYITAVTGSYDVDGTVTRGQMAAFIIRALYSQYGIDSKGDPYSNESFEYTQTPYFADVPSTHIFFQYVQKMKDDGITAVTGTYDVDRPVTRDQMSAFLSRAFLGMR